MHLKPQFIGAIGLMEEIEVEAYLQLMQGRSAITASSPSICALFRFITRPIRNMARVAID